MLMLMETSESEILSLLFSALLFPCGVQLLMVSVLQHWPTGKSQANQDSGVQAGVVRIIAVRQLGPWLGHIFLDHNQHVHD